MSHLVAAVCAGLVYTSTMHDSFALGPQPGHGIAAAGMAEIVYTLVLCFVVLSVATVTSPSLEMFGLAIGPCVTVGGYAVGSVSGASLNPAVSVGLGPRVGG